MKKHDRYGTEQEDNPNMPRHYVHILSNLASPLQPHLLTTAFQLGLDQVRNSASLYA
jgi:hypothetical protein